MEPRVRRMVLALAGFQTMDALLCAVPNRYIRDDLDRLGVPEGIRPVIPVAKGASAVGLAVGLHHRRVGVVTTACLLLYFSLAIGAHVRTRDAAWRYGAAFGMLLWSRRAWQAFRNAA